MDSSTVAAILVTALFQVRPVQTQAPVASQFQIVIDNAAHLKYGLYYPVTYIFTLPAGSSGLTVVNTFGSGVSP